jgi:pimeloyl-ACP methyl ester carboxylesterase
MPFARPLVGPVMRMLAINAWKRMFYDPVKDTAEVREAYLRPGEIYGSMNTVWQMWRDVRRDKPIDFSRLTLPVLILWAEKERVIPFPGRALRWLQWKLPHAVTEHIPLTGHMLLEEQPEAINRLVSRFLETPAAAAPAPAGTHVA